MKLREDSNIAGNSVPGKLPKSIKIVGKVFESVFYNFFEFFENCGKSVGKGRVYFFNL